MSDSLLCIIPAKGTSTRLPRKNIAPLGGKPLLAHTIKAAYDSQILDRICVSTEDEEIAEVARSFGAEVPFMRPAELSREDVPGIQAVLHAVRLLEELEGYCPKYVVVLPPTSPFRTEQDIRAAVHLAQERKADGVVSVCSADQHPYWMKRLTEDGRLTNFLSGDREYLSQELPPLYIPNGAIYLARRTILLKQQMFYTDRTYAYIMPSERSLDIDTPWDLYMADLILKDRLHREGG